VNELDYIGCACHLNQTRTATTRSPASFSLDLLILLQGQPTIENSYSLMALRSNAIDNRLIERQKYPSGMEVASNLAASECADRSPSQVEGYEKCQFYE
jgi:hypothetical protein